MELNESRCVGSVVGLAVGDTIGYPAEFRRRAQILEEIGVDGINDFIALKDPRFSRPFFTGPDHPPGTFTDDTQMSIAVAESLLRADCSDLDQLMEEMSRRFVAWAGSSKNNRAPGGACMQGCGNLFSGVPWREAGVRRGCLSLKAGPSVSKSQCSIFSKSFTALAATLRHWTSAET